MLIIPSFRGKVGANEKLMLASTFHSLYAISAKVGLYKCSSFAKLL